MNKKLNHLLGILLLMTIIISLVTSISYATSTSANENEITSIKLQPVTATIKKGQLLKLQATITPSNASSAKLTWKSSNESIAIVGTNGAVFGRSAGTTIITAKSSNNKLGYCILIVTENGQTTTSTTITSTPISISSLKISPSTKTMTEGETTQLTCTITPSNATNQTLTWKTNSEKIASVSNTGKVTAIRKGLALITVQSSNGIRSTAVINVKAKETVTPVTPTTPVDTDGNNKPIYSHTLNGKKVKSFSNDSIDVKIEKYSSYYITKIWVKDPSQQLKKAEAGWGKKLKTVKTMLNASQGAIVGINGSGFYRAGTWTPSSKWDKAILKTSWNYTTEGNYVIANGIVRRALNGQNAKTTLGITKNGEMKYYENAPYSELEKDNVYNSFAFGPLLIKDGQKYTQKNSGVRLRQSYTSKARRTVVGQVDSNNYVFIIPTGVASLNSIKTVGMKLDCKILFNLDGGGSTSLWFRNGASGSGTNVTGGGRAVADALYFTTL